MTAQPTIPQLGMQDWSKGSNLFPTSESSLTLSDVTSSAVEGPAINSADALNTATRLTETTADDQHYSSAVFVAYSGIEYTLSVFVKKGTYDQIRLVTSSNRIQSNIYFTFSTEAFTATTYSPAAEDYGNGWYRLSWTATAKTDFGASGNCSLYLAPLDLSSYVGATSKYTDFFGWQVEIGDTMGNYIPTNGLLAQDATLTANPYNAGYDVVGNALRTRNKGLNLGGDLTSTSSAALVSTGTKLGFYVGSDARFSNANYTDGDWYHLVGVKSSGVFFMYENGVAQSGTTANTNSMTNAFSPFIGKDTTASRFYQDEINEVRAYNRALSLTEITNNYKVGKSKHSN